MKEQEVPPFVATLLELVRPLLTASAGTANTLDAFRARAQSQLKWPPDAFVVRVFLKAIRLNSVLDELRRIRVLMGALPATEVLKRAGMTKTEFVHYHLSNYRIVAFSALDRGLELCNEATRLGFKSTSLKMDRISGKVSEPVRKALETLKATALPASLSEQRNDYVHRGYVHQLPEFEHLGIIELSKGFNRLAIPGLPSKMVIQGIRLELAVLRPRMMAEERKLRDAVNGLLNALLPAFKHEYGLLRVKWLQLGKTELARRREAERSDGT